MDPRQNRSSESRIAARRQQEEQLRQNEGELRRLQARGSKGEFFGQILPLLNPLKSYLKRQLRIGYLNLQIRRPVFTSGDLLDEVVLRAYEHYDEKPPNLTLEQWLYQIANEIVANYIRGASRRDAKRRSLEDLTRKELKELEEPITADAEGEVMLVEDLDDSELPENEFVPPAQQEDQARTLEEEELVGQILDTLSRIPPRERTVFDLSVLEGFSNENVAKIAQVSPDEVPEIVNKVRNELRQELDVAQRRSDEAHHEAGAGPQLDSKKAA